MSLQIIHALTISGLVIIAGVIGFVIGGLLGMRSHRKAKMRAAQVQPSGKKSEKISNAGSSREALTSR